MTANNRKASINVDHILSINIRWESRCTLYFDFQDNKVRLIFRVNELAVVMVIIWLFVQGIEVFWGGEGEGTYNVNYINVF